MRADENEGTPRDSDGKFEAKSTTRLFRFRKKLINQTVNVKTRDTK